MLAMLRAWLHGLVLGAVLFFGVLVLGDLSFPFGIGPFDTVGQAIWGLTSLIVFFLLFAAMFSLPFVLLALGVAWFAPGWTNGNAWVLALGMTALTALVWTLADQLQIQSIIGAVLVSGLFAWRWTRPDVSP